MLIVKMNLDTLEDAENVGKIALEKKIGSSFSIAKVELCFLKNGALKKSFEFELSIRTSDRKWEIALNFLRQLKPTETVEIYGIKTPYVCKKYEQMIDRLI